MAIFFLQPKLWTRLYPCTTWPSSSLFSLFTRGLWLSSAATGQLVAVGNPAEAPPPTWDSLVATVPSGGWGAAPSVPLHPPTSCVPACCAAALQRRADGKRCEHHFTPFLHAFVKITAYYNVKSDWCAWARAACTRELEDEGVWIEKKRFISLRTAAAAARIRRRRRSVTGSSVSAQIPSAIFSHLVSRKSRSRPRSLSRISDSAAPSPDGLFQEFDLPFSRVTSRYVFRQGDEKCRRGHICFPARGPPLILTH